MARLLFVLADLYPTRLTAAACAALPRLPALERWLGRGRRFPTGDDWRQALQREWPRTAHAAALLAAAPPASVAGAVVADASADAALWFATPVHFVAGLDTLRLHPAGLLHLEADEQRMLAADFARAFDGLGWMLHATGRRELLLVGGGATGAAARGVRSRDPARSLGADPTAGLPSGPGAAPLRRLGAEVEMWLHEHPVNQARLSRGQLPANALWFWGGGAGALRPGAVRGAAAGAEGPASAWAGDLFVDGLASLTGTVVAPRPERWPSEPESGRGDRLCVCELGAVPDERSLRALDDEWVAPAMARWRRGDYDSATLLAGGLAFRLERGSLRQFGRALRRARPWWEWLLQC